VTWPGRIVASIRRDVPLAFLDLGVIFTAYILPLILRFNGRVPADYWRNFRFFIPVPVLAHLLTNYLFGLYGQMWRYASVQEARRVVLSASVGGGAVVAADYVIRGRVTPLPLSVVALGAALSLMGFGAIRFESRLFAFRRRSEVTAPARVLLVGAGDAGAMVLKDILRNPSLGLDPLGLIDDNVRNVGLSLHGVRILGTRAAIPHLLARLRIDQVLLTIPSATSDLVRDVAEVCEAAGVTLRVLPSVREVVGGRVTARDIRDLRIEDLLGREQVDMDTKAVRAMLQGRRVLITGAGGSIGSEIARQVADFDPSQLVLLDHDETHLHDILLDLDGKGDVRSVLADIRNQDRVLDVFMTYRPQVVFHAAAHKHVPVLEEYPEEALFTNVIGTAIVTDAAVATSVDRFVLISTDKSVNPASIMGASKRFAEQIVQSIDEKESSTFCAVRFGNVLGSRGSVIPTFFRQIAKGGPVTVTDPSMARYFMSVQEAVQLVLQAAALSTGGEVFTLDMGQPINILDLARKLIRLSGRTPDKDIEIAIVGRRPGEKFVEEIASPDEESIPSESPAIMVWRPQPPDRPGLKRAIRELEGLAAEGRRDELAERMRTLAGQHVRATTAVRSLP
jgi:FlaA1/EpsC-like NDP-sugar epimerase